MPNIFRKTCEEETIWITYTRQAKYSIKIDTIGIEHELDTSASKWSPITVYF